VIIVGLTKGATGMMARAALQGQESDGVRSPFGFPSKHFPSVISQGNPSFGHGADEPALERARR
jgi:hypothetical protein